ncbi:1,4-alpha-glucan branching protein GlgB [Euzebya rosea]|uniref:1,4-alpha-glucan branching protein GlgB n=1 Tax=Euzebya rosea TaxID=2052804 RepID=UPI000D3EC92B|nr:1,4-alpha-glucan branching protein GlgB [Euzebya rosea]
MATTRPDLPDLPDLTAWLTRQRWFAAKDRPIEAARVADAVPLRVAGDPRTWLVTVAVDHADDGPSTSWQLVLTRRLHQAEPLLGTVDGVPVTELVSAPRAALALLDSARRGAHLAAASGATVTARPVGRSPDPAPTERLMGVEQSNTSVVLGEQVAVKVIRRLEPGPNPDVEITEALTTAGFEGTPPLLGVITGPDETAMAVMTGYVLGSHGAWELAVAEAAGTADHGVADRMADLGRLTAEMHRTLASTLEVRQSTVEDADRMRNRLMEDARTTERTVPEVGSGLVDAVANRRAATPSTMGRLQRIHGDFHLGQVITDGDDGWMILDFEGEPGRPVSERRRPDHPLRDVAGMLRSFAYAEAAAVRAGGDPDAAGRWRHRAEQAFVDGYGAVDRPWLDLFVLDKLLYEARYEAANRPDWLQIPLQALAPLGATMATPSTPSESSKGRKAKKGRKAGATEAGAPETSTPEASPAPTTPATAAPAPPAAPAAAEPDLPDIGEDVQALRDGRLHDPHRLLGRHQLGDGTWVVRTWRPGAVSAELVGVADAGQAEEVTGGLFQATTTSEPDPGTYRWRITYPDDQAFELVDAYAFEPTLGEVDMHLLAEGRHEQAWTAMGANPRTMHGIDGFAFAVWAPNAQSVRLVGSFNSWDGRLHPMRSLGSSGIWELFVPDVPNGAHYKYEIVTADGSLVLRADPWAKWSDVPPGTASRVWKGEYEWTAAPPSTDHLHGPMSIYEVHLASWRWTDDGEGGRRPLTYRELADELGDYVADMGFTHVEFLPVAEHPFGGSWGYQVTGHFAPTSRFGTPDDFRYLVDRLHDRGIGVIVDWVPAHFPKDEWALANYDGTKLYEHADPRQGEHPDWGTLVFNYARTEVKNFLMASALFWLESLHVDGLRVDAVASMLYLDYSRKSGEWVPNKHGGRENLEAVELLQEVNATAYKRNPHAFTVAEESTAWPGVSRPTHLGGLGFGFKWNMGWMHDTLSYFSKEPVYRRWHHNQLTFGMMYAWSEHFVLPLSHDEVVHGKGSLIGKMPGDRWQRFANLRALYGWMWGHPGKQLLFMGGEIAQEREWSEERELDWPSLMDSAHAGVRDLVRDANRAYRDLPALWRRDDDPTSFQWIDANNADANLLAFVRYGADGDPAVAVVANLSPMPQHDLRIGLPHTGGWREALNTDSEIYGGGNVGNMGRVEATDQPWHGLPASALISAPPLGVVWFVAED